MAFASLSGCASFHHKKKPAVAVEAPAPAAPQLVGTVTLVREDHQFVLIQTSPLFTPDVGQALKCMSNGQETAILTVSPERSHPFITADVVRGTPRRGDEVYQ